MPLIAPLIRAGFNVALYGGYWERYRETRRHTRGHADPVTVRKATAAAKVVLCLVRRANRDGHVMRTFEASAMGACMLTEHTEEHEEVLGPDGDAVVYFRKAEEMLQKLHWLLGDEEARARLAERARRRVISGAHTYQDRLQTLLSLRSDSAWCHPRGKADEPGEGSTHGTATCTHRPWPLPRLRSGP